jgi:biotin transport system substrate-specific component
VAATVPGSSVPQSAQTLVVLLVGALLGARLGAATLVAWLLVGGLGAPVFAGGASGWEHLVGPTAGYLLGFTVAAAAVGRLAERGLLRRPAPALAVMIGGHGVILALGWARLAGTLGPTTAFRQGVAPFVVGGVLKSLAAVAVVVAVARVKGASSLPAMED